jgi:hypothetical protein
MAAIHGDQARPGSRVQQSPVIEPDTSRWVQASPSIYPLSLVLLAIHMITGYRCH